MFLLFSVYSRAASGKKYSHMRVVKRYFAPKHHLKQHQETMEDTCMLLSPEGLSKTILCKLNDMRLNGENCDITLKIQGREIRAHRAVLAAGIPYFSHMFSSKMKESYLDEITIKDLDYSALESLINFVYSCHLKISQDNARSLLVCSQYLDMDVAYNACCSFLANRLSPDNVLEIWDFARRYSVIRLVDSAEKYIEKHFVKVSHSDGFLHVSFSDLKLLIAKDELLVPNEESVFEAVMSWVKRSVEDRKDELPKLLTLVRMPRLSLEYLSEHVASDELIHKSSICRDLVIEAIDFHGTEGKVPCSFATQPRCLPSGKYCAIDALQVLCSTKGSNPQLVVQCFDHQFGMWTEKEAKTTYVTRATVAVMGKKLYVIGGLNRKTVLNTVQVFHMETGSWSFIPSMNKRRFKSAAASVSNKLYVCGGKAATFGNPMSSAECFDPARKKWVNLPEMLMCCEQACAVAFDDQLYVLGRLFGEIAVTSFFCIYVEKYNPITNQWAYVTGMNPGPMGGALSATAQNDKILVLSDCSIEVFDFRTGKWNRYCSAPKYDASPVLLEFQEKLYVFYLGCGMLYIYDSEKGEWSKGVPLPEHVVFEGGGIISAL